MNMHPKYARLVRRSPEHQEHKTFVFVMPKISRKILLFVAMVACIVLMVSVGIFFLSPRGDIKGVSAGGYHYQYKNGKSSFDSISFARSDKLLPSYRINDGVVSLAMTYSPTAVRDTYEVISDSSGSIKSLTFKDVELNTNIIYTLEGENTVKEDIELTKAPAKESLSSYTFTIELAGLAYERDNNGAVIPIFFDKQGTEYSIPPLVMKDAGGKESNLVTLKLSTPNPDSPNILTAIVTPDSTWLADPLRAYPVRIDPSVVKGNAPVSYWKIDEGTGSSINDASVNANTLSITNATWQVNGAESGNSIGRTAIRFDGAGDYLTRTYDSDFDFGTNSFSVSMWARIPPVAAGPDVLLARFAGAGFKIYMDASEFICFGIDDDSTWGPDDSACTTTAYNDGRWHHIEAVKSGTSSITLYIDGVMKKVNAATTADSSLSGSSPALYIGIDSDGTSNSFQGDIDSVSIFNYERDVNQVKADVFTKTQMSVSFGSSPMDSLTSGLSGYWKMDESSANTCTGGVNDSCDSSGNGKDGSWVGNATTTVGRYGQGTYYDGTGDDTLLSTVTYGGDTTFSAWVKLDSTVSDCSTYHPILSNGTSLQNGMYISGASCNGISLRGNTAVGVNSLSATVTQDLKQWHHIVGVSDSTGKGYLYLDGQFIGANLTEFTPTSVTSGGIEFGHAKGYASRYFKGSLDEIRIYNRVLSPAEVRALYDYAPGPVGYWKLDENTSTAANDSSGNGNGLTLTNTPSWVVGKYGSGVLFSGSNQHLLRADDPDFDFADDASMTVETWLKHGTASAQEVILSKYNEAGYKIIMESDGDITCALDYDSTWTPTDSATSTASTYDDDAWHHIACVKTSASSLDLYIDGVLVATDASLTATNTLTNSDPLYVGIDADGTSNDFTGRLDEVRIYNYARTLNQIVEDLNGGHPLGGSPVGSQAVYWKMDEGYGTSINDTSSRIIYKGSFGCFGSSCANPAWSNAGKFGKALYFTGSGATGGYVYANPINNPATTGSKITISTWINPDATQNGSGWYVRNGTGVDMNYGLYIGSTTSGGKFKVGIQRYTTTWVDNSTTGYYVPVSTWSHVVTVFSQGEWMKVYVNGELKETVALTGLSAISTSTFNIGGHNGTTYQMLNGYMDEFKVYTGELSAEEIRLDFNQGRATVLGSASTASDGKTPDSSASREYCVPGDTATCNPPVAEWKFDDPTVSSGQSAVDTSGNNNHLQLGSTSGADSNDPIWVNGKMGKALYLDGIDSYATKTSSSAPTGQNPWTLSLWANIEAMTMGGRGYRSSIIEWGSNASNYTTSKLTYTYSSPTTTIDWYTTPGNTVNVTSYDGDKRWIYITVTYDGTTVKTYMNGVAQNSANYTMAIDNSDILFGGYTQTMTSNATTDEARIYNYARTPAQIAWDYNRGRPVAHYKLDECTGSTVHSQYEIYNSNLNGTITIGASGTQTSVGTCGSEGTTAWYNGATGKLNASLNFDGTDDYISISNPSIDNFGTTGEFSVSAWFKTATTGVQMQILDNKTAGTNNAGFNLQFLSDQSIYLRIGNGSAQAGLIVGASPYLDGTWHHVVGIFKRGTSYDEMYIYFDGVLKGSTTSLSAGWNITSSQDLLIGTYGGANNANFSGQLDDVRVYNYPLTPAQIQTIYTNGAVSFK
jgi:hypothetical protein